ncbi:hypothetical protein, conserved, partial [Eimeria tenella]
MGASKVGPRWVSLCLLQLLLLLLPFAAAAAPDSPGGAPYFSPRANPLALLRHPSSAADPLQGPSAASRALSWAPLLEALHVGQKGLHITHKGPQEAHETPQGTHKGPQGAQEESQEAHEGPQEAHEGPQGPRKEAQEAHEGPQGAHRGPQGPPEVRHIAQEGPQVMVQGPPEAPLGPPVSPEGPPGPGGPLRGEGSSPEGPPDPAFGGNGLGGDAAAAAAGLDDWGAAEWVQLLMEGQRLPLTGKLVGKVTPSPPVLLRPQAAAQLHAAAAAAAQNGGCSGAPEPPEAAAAAAAAAAAGGVQQPALLSGFVGPYGGEQQLLACRRPPREAPSRVQLVVHVEMLQPGAPVLYAFRWGKPATWTEYDYKLVVQEEGVYSLELREPLLFPEHRRPHLLHAEGPSVGGPTFLRKSLGAPGAPE